MQAVADVLHGDRFSLHLSEDAELLLQCGHQHREVLLSDLGKQAESWEQHRVPECTGQGRSGEHIHLAYLQEQVCEGNGSLQFVFLLFTEYSLHFYIFTRCFKFVGEVITLTYFIVFEFVKISSFFTQVRGDGCVQSGNHWLLVNKLAICLSTQHICEKCINFQVSGDCSNSSKW